MEALKKLDLKSISIPKVIGLIIIGLIVLVLAIWLVSFAFRTAIHGPGYSNYATSDHSFGAPAMYYEDGFDVDYAEETFAMKSVSGERLIAPIPPVIPGSTGHDAESFEITSYHSTIRTGNIEESCGDIEALKDFSYVIFENANRHDSNCSYSFKVENDKADEVIAVIESLDPESLNQNTHTIKNIVDNYTSESEILEKRLASIEETLSDAQEQYEVVERLAAQKQDVESLANIIESRLNLINRLSQERINVKNQIDRINKSKADQLDRLQFTFFNVSVYESHIVDLERIKDSWTYELKNLVSDLNAAFQALTTGLVVWATRVIVAAIYIILLILVIKYGWRGARKLWKL